MATLVLALPHAPGFALAGGAALIFYEVTDRGTRDLDCFGPSSESVDLLAPVATTALREAGFEVTVETVIQASDGSGSLFRDATTRFDLGFDPAALPPTATELGAVLALPDLAGDTLLALFSRAAPRDFVDVVGLLRRFTRDEL